MTIHLSKAKSYFWNVRFFRYCKHNVGSLRLDTFSVKFMKLIRLNGVYQKSESENLFSEKSRAAFDFSIFKIILNPL